MEGLFALIFLGVIVAIGLGLYFLPSIIAKMNNQPNFVSILVLNFFLGWSLVGWVVSLVWAVKKV